MSYALSAREAPAIATLQFSPRKVAQDFSDQIREASFQTKAHNIYLPQVIYEEDPGTLFLSDHLAGVQRQSREMEVTDAPDLLLWGLLYLLS